MEEEDDSAVALYLKCGKYPDGFTKNKKRSLRRKAMESLTSKYLFEPLQFRAGVLT